jgi:MscS family membrane protein
LGLVVMAGFWWLGVNSLGLSTDALLVFLVAVKLLAGLSGIWSAYRLIDFASSYLQHKARKSQNKLDDVVVPLFRKTLKVAVTFVGVLFIASSLKLNLTGLIAGLGLGGLAFALAAKDMVQNLFGSVTVLLDQSFHVGDWVVIGDVEGTVEEVGLRSTRIRTFYNSTIILPNSTLITASIDNMGKRKYRRFKCKLSVTYQTPPDKIEAFCEALRELVRLHSYMRKDYYQVYLTDLAASSLEILVYVFWEAPDWSTELRERHRFLIDVLKIAEVLEIEFAYPTQTIQWTRAEGGAVADGIGEAPSDRSALIRQGRAAARAVVEQVIDPNTKPSSVSFTRID